MATATAEETTAAQAATKSKTLSIAGLPGEYTTTALILPDKLGIVRWQSVISAVAGVRESSRFWLGDALNYGERKYGEKYAQALDESKFDYKTLANFVQVSKRVAPATRREDLTWSHHEAVAYLPDADQIILLDQAASGAWSVAELRASVRDLKASRADSTTPAPTPRTRNTDSNEPEARPVGPVAANSKTPAEPIGVLPIPSGTALPAEYYRCANCDLPFAENIFECLDCGAHCPIASDDCTNPLCPSNGGAPIANDEGNGSATVVGTVITAGDELGPQVVDTLVSLSGARSIDVSEIVAYVAQTGEDASAVISSLMGLSEWLGRVIDGLSGGPETVQTPVVVAPPVQTTEAPNGTLSPAPKPASKARKTKAPAPVAPVMDDDDSLPLD